MRRKATTASLNFNFNRRFSTMLCMNLRLTLLLSFIIPMYVADCPRLCECKWKSGKESVICLNANLSLVPLHLDAGTQVLDLSGNNLVTLKHEEFRNAGLLNLQKVYIAKCRLKIIERYAFRMLINLIELDLSYNALNTIPSHTFDSIPELRELKLNGNPIQKIPNEAFFNTMQLVKLDISYCRISLIEPKAFHGLEKSLEWLKIDNNKLTEVQAQSFTILHNLHGLELTGNPWNCSCVLRSLREWMLWQNVPYDVPPSCQSPKRLYQKSWDKLDLDEFACVPEIFAFESKTHGIEGKNVTMTCRISGIPKPNVKWVLKNKVIANLSGSTFASGKKLYVVHLTNDLSDLTIFSADLQDAGTYTCSAENKAGKAEASVTLAVSKKPPEFVLTHKVLVVSILSGIAFAIFSCAMAACLCSIRKRKLLKWRARDCRREDNYEKIEMNQKVVPNVNGGVTHQESEIGAAKKNGDYHVVPGADTEGDEDDDCSTVAVTTPGTSNNKIIVSKGGNEERCWSSPEKAYVDETDLHIPRRTVQESRDNIKKTYSSMFGTYKPGPSLISPSPVYLSHPTSRTAQPVATASSSNPIATSCYKTEPLTILPEIDRHIPDVIGSSPYARCVHSRAQSESGSVSDINELFCTLPRKTRDIKRYKSSDSQSPLLPESRYGSSGGESAGGNYSQENFRRLSADSQRYPVINLNRNRVNKISSSFLNLTREEYEQNSTPLLDISGLENRLAGNSYNTNCNSIKVAVTVPNGSYDYHAAQLERFLEEYRCLQKQLTKMKETCDSLCQEKGLPSRDVNSPITPSASSSEKSSALNNPICSPNSNKSIEESVDFKNFESELTKYLLSKNSSPKNFNASSIFPN